MTIHATSPPSHPIFHPQTLSRNSGFATGIQHGVSLNFISGHDGKIQATTVFFGDTPTSPQDLDVTTDLFSLLWPVIPTPTSSHRSMWCSIYDKHMPYQRSQFKLSMESPVDDPESTLASFNRQFGLNGTEKTAVEWAWPMEMNDTMFAVVNTYTRAAQMDGLSAESSFRLSRVGGNILGMLQ